MKATGIVRRIDDLGRVVIPKEIRRNLKIKEGDPLEIFIDSVNGKPTVAFLKYNPSDDYDLETLAGMLRLVAGECPFVLCDANGEVVTEYKVVGAEEVEPTDYTFNVNGYDVAFLSTAVGEKGNLLYHLGRVYFEQYER